MAIMAQYGGLHKGLPSLMASSACRHAGLFLLAFSLSLMFLVLCIFSDQLPSSLYTPAMRPLPNSFRSDTNVDQMSKNGSLKIFSWEPRAFIYHNFLSKEECEHLIKLATPYMVKSAVIDIESGRSKHSRDRTSSGMFLERGQDEVVKSIEKRISELTFTPVEHGEGIQVLHYEVGQKYDAHHDYFHDKFSLKNGGQRIATVLMYLSDVEAGGETVFPDAKMTGYSAFRKSKPISCGNPGLTVKPRQGDALLFFSMKLDSSLDPLSLHGGCPVIHGDKWSATKWLHATEYKV